MSEPTGKELSEALAEVRALLYDAAKQSGEEAAKLAGEVLRATGDLTADWMRGHLSGENYLRGLESCWNAQKSGLARITRDEARDFFGHAIKSGLRFLGGLVGGLPGLFSLKLR